MHAIIYRRYSSDEQGDGSAQTLDVQLERCQSYAAALNVTVVEVLTDKGKSAFHSEHLRPDADLGRFLQRLRAGEFARGTVLIADNLSRLSRRPVDEAMAWAHEVNSYGIEIALADRREILKPNPDMGEYLQRAIKFSVAHQSSADKSDATRRSKTKLWTLAERREGKWTNLAGLLPTWLTRNAACDDFIIDGKKAEIINTIYQWSADGVGVNTIVRMLNARPDLPPFGKPEAYKTGGPTWSRSTVRQLLLSVIVEGDFRPKTGMFGGRVIHDFYPRIVDADLVARGRAALASRKKVAGQSASTGHTNLFAGVTLCGECGRRSSMTTGTRKGRSYSYIRCEASQEGRCGNRGGYSYRAFETTALDLFLDLALEDRFFEATGELGQGRVRKAEVDKALGDCRSRKLSLLRSFDGADPEVATVIAEIDAQIATLTAESADVERAIEQATGRVGNIEHLRRVGDIRKAATSQIDEIRIQARSKLRLALTSIVSRVEIERDPTGAKVFTLVLRGGVMAVRIDMKGRIKKVLSEAGGRPLYSYLPQRTQDMLAPLIQRIEKLSA